MRITRNALLAAIVTAIVAVAMGCGGGGGGTTPPPTDKFTVTGVVRDISTNSFVVGAVVKVSTYQTSTGADGTFRIEMPISPVVQTYSVSGRNASPGCFDFWAQAGGQVQNATCIDLPLIPKGETSLGTIYLMNTDSPPPFPPSCP